MKNTLKLTTAVALALALNATPSHANFKSGFVVGGALGYSHMGTRFTNNSSESAFIGVAAQSSSPGNEQREFWGSYVADSKGSRNYSGIKDPVVDKLIEQIIDAQDRDTLTTTTKALDRVLLWGHYVVPMWGSSKYRQAYWHNLQHNGKTLKM